MNRESFLLFSEIEYELSQRTVALKVELYHELIHGYGNSSFSSNIIEYIEVDDAALQ